MHLCSTFLSRLRLMLVGIYLAWTLLGIILFFFDHYIQTSARIRTSGSSVQKYILFTFSSWRASCPPRLASTPCLRRLRYLASTSCPQYFEQIHQFRQHSQCCMVCAWKKAPVATSCKQKCSKNSKIFGDNRNVPRTATVHGFVGTVHRVRHRLVGAALLQSLSVSKTHIHTLEPIVYIWFSRPRVFCYYYYY